MDRDLEAIKAALVQYSPEGMDGSFVDLFVIPHVTPANVHEVLKVMSEHEDLNRAFWKMINRAPTTEEGWRSLMFIGSGMSDEELQERNRQRLRQAVEVVRKALGPIRVRRNELFRHRS